MDGIYNTIEQAVKAVTGNGVEIAVAEKFKPRRIIKPADLVKTSYLETPEAANARNKSSVKCRPAVGAATAPS